MPWTLAALVTTGTLGGCSSRPARSREAVAADSAAAVRARSQALIENGNQAFRAGDYALAARRYASAAVVDPDDPAAYYGLGMALGKLGRDEQARVAYGRARDLVRRGRSIDDSLDTAP
ncbi:MAG: tetratricopeptide repeat protein [Candidatus Eisenbacteria bacterium]